MRREKNQDFYDANQEVLNLKYFSTISTKNYLQRVGIVRVGIKKKRKTPKNNKIKTREIFL